MNPHEPVRPERPGAARTSWRGALLWAAAGAGLFLGVGAGVPGWPPWEITIGPPGRAIVMNDGPAPLWEAARSLGLVNALARPGVVALLAGGGVAGMLARTVFVAVSRQKGGTG